MLAATILVTTIEKIVAKRIDARATESRIVGRKLGRLDVAKRCSA
jgi:hypothetical protein